VPVLEQKQVGNPPRRPRPAPRQKQGAALAGIHGNRRRVGAALPALAFVRMRAPESPSAARLLWTTFDSTD